MSSHATVHERTIPRAALEALFEQARAAVAAGDEAQASTLLAELHWYAHDDGPLHEEVHRLEMARARRRGDVGAVLGQLVPLAAARATSFVENLGPSFEVVEEIAAPPEVVYDVLSDVGAYVTWNPWVIHAAGEARVGDEIVVQARLGKATVQVTHRVLAMAPGERFAWCDLGLFTYFASGRRLRWIERTETGCRLVSKIVLFGPFAHLAWRMHGDHIRDGLTAEARALADRAAGLARAAAPARANGQGKGKGRARGAEGAVVDPSRPLAGMTCVVTGPTRGIGRPTTLTLGRLGARVLLLCRDADKGAALARELEALGGSGEVVPVDLSSLRSVADAAADVQKRAPRLDLLINNAGVLNHARRETGDGFEECFGVNFLAHYLLTMRLLPSLAAAPAARIVHVSSNTHEVIPGFDFDDYNFERRRYIGLRAYGHSKLAVLLFNRGLARQLEGTRIVSNGLHPGVIATGMGTDVPVIGGLLTRLVRPFFLTPEAGARTTLYVALNPTAALTRGAYFANCRVARPSRWVEDDAAAERIYRLGAALLERHGFAAQKAA